MHALLLLALLALPAQALALGDIQAAVADGVLEVTGDGEPNVFRLAGSGAGTVVVSVFEGTTVNGGAAPVTLPGVSDLKVTAGAGDDRMELAGLDLAGALTMKLGRGVDSVILQDVRVQGTAQIEGGRDRDVLTVRGFSRFRGQLVVEGGKGADEVTLTNATLSAGARLDMGRDGDTVLVQLSALDAGQAMVVRGGKGDDLVTLVGSDFFGDVALDLGGDDALDFDGAVGFDPLVPQRIVDFEVTN